MRQWSRVGLPEKLLVRTENKRLIQRVADYPDELAEYGCPPSNSSGPTSFNPLVQFSSKELRPQFRPASQGRFQ